MDINIKLKRLIWREIFGSPNLEYKQMKSPALSK